MIDRRRSPQVFWLRHPIKERSQYYFYFVAVGVLVSWTLAYLFVLMVLWPFFNFGELPASVYLASVILGIGGIVLFVWWQGTRPYRVAHRRNPYRLSRLRSLASHPHGNRFPHRLIELCLRERSTSPRQLDRVLRRANPGVAVVVLPNNMKEWPYWQCLETHFEPIDLDQDAAQLFEAWDTELYESKETDPAGRFSWQRTNALLGSIVVYGLAMLMFGEILFRAIFKSRGLWVIGVIGAVIIFHVFARLLVDRKWWIYPGGLMRRIDIIGRKTVVQILQPQSSNLLLDFRTNSIVVADERRSYRKDAEDTQLWAVLAAWTCAARQPTHRELLAFLNLDEQKAKFNP